ncbi:MAG: D-2-hydroxyacid dehydrogenase, partial [Planctomycetales bacterium]|nr:D-2-hydroxyacid dehydrogenase [Planctomycetales bacterium]
VGVETAYSTLICVLAPRCEQASMRTTGSYRLMPTGLLMRVVLGYPVEPQHVARIATQWPDADLVPVEQEALAEALLDCDVFCGHAKVPVPWDEIVGRGRLQWIQSSAAGMDHCLVPSVIESDIVVSSASGVLARQVVDQTMALLAGVLRSLPAFFSAQRRKEFVRRPTRDLYGTRVGLIGLGGNGRLLAKTLKAFNVEIWATDYFPSETCVHVDRLLPADAVDEMLPKLDSLILTAPLTELTRGMIDKRRLALLPADAALVNVARGPLVVENDLVDALENGHLWGAGVDVTEIEPLPTESRLWEAPRTLITPHVGGQRKSRIDDMTELFCENIRRRREGRTLANLVDKRLGFPHPANLYRAVR